MSIQEMTSMSYFLLAMGGIFVVAAVILFVWLDIPKCVRMVLALRLRDKKKSDQVIELKPRNILGNQMDMTTEKLHDKESFPDGSEETLLLENEESIVMDIERTQLLPDTDKTLLLDGTGAETELMETSELEMIQDIVYVRDR